MAMERTPAQPPLRYLLVPGEDAPGAAGAAHAHDGQAPAAPNAARFFDIPGCLSRNPSNQFNLHSGRHIRKLNSKG